MDELGIVGLVLLLVVTISVLVRSALRARGPDRALHAAVFALLLAWALAAGIDWDWEMPVVTIVFFVVGGFALARPLQPHDRMDDREAGQRRQSALAPYVRT